MDFVQFGQNYLLLIVMPIWLAAGLLDWWCHRTSHIETTSGVGESLLHLAMLAEGGFAVLIGLFLEVNGLVLALFVATYLVHEATSYWDLTFANARREVRPFEQRVHDYLGVVPFAALSLVLVLHWPQAAAWFGAGPEPLKLTLEWKHQPLSTTSIASLLGAIVVFELVPFLEELIRTLRARTARGRTHRNAAP
jgi:hypothetical protein